MKLSSEQHEELSKMTEHFSRIEDLAERMGVEVDTLAEDFNKNNSDLYANFKKNLLAIASKRQQIFRMSNSLRNSSETPTVNFSVIVNEERFLS